MSETIPSLTQEDGQSKDMVKENVEKLKQLFPEIVTDGEVDFETLKEELGQFREESNERYSFTWNGKSKARKLAMEPDRKSTRLNSSHVSISYAVFCLKKKTRM